MTLLPCITKDCVFWVQFFFLIRGRASLYHTFVVIPENEGFDVFVDQRQSLRWDVTLKARSANWSIANSIRCMGRYIDLCIIWKNCPLIQTARRGIYFTQNYRVLTLLNEFVEWKTIPDKRQRILKIAGRQYWFKKRKNDEKCNIFTE